MVVTQGHRACAFYGGMKLHMQEMCFPDEYIFSSFVFNAYVYCAPCPVSCMVACLWCSQAYYGGEARCVVQADMSMDYDPNELVCGGCSNVEGAQVSQHDIVLLLICNVPCMHVVSKIPDCFFAIVLLSGFVIVHVFSLCILTQCCLVWSTSRNPDQFVPAYIVDIIVGINFQLSIWWALVFNK